MELLINMDKIKAIIFENVVLTENSNEARLLFDKSTYGEVMRSGQVQLSFVEALYLVEKDKIEIVLNDSVVGFVDLLNKFKEKEDNVWVRFCTYKDLRDRGYLVKTALKFGADFRVYDKGIKQGEDHSKWIVFAVSENKSLTWQEYAGKNRVAHSTKKRLMIAIVDDEGDVSYYENSWIRP